MYDDLYQVLFWFIENCKNSLWNLIHMSNMQV